MIANSLYPEFEAKKQIQPGWFKSHGLHKYKPLVRQLYAARPLITQAEHDGILNLCPIIMLFNAPPAEIKKQVGGHIWHAMRKGSLHDNVNRMACRLIGGWSLDEAMEWPVGDRRHAKERLRSNNKSAILIACRHTNAVGGSMVDHLTIALDFQRMGGVIDTDWGKKRLKREHDALAMERMYKSTDPTPWAKPWHCEIDGYIFTLLKSETELALEGITQRHCCRSYANACRNGHEVVFSVMGPERATVSWNTNQSYLQAKSFANGAVSGETRRAASQALGMYLGEVRA